MIKNLNSINEKPIRVQSREVVPDLSGTKDQSHGRQSLHGPGQGWWGDVLRMIQVH